MDEDDGFQAVTPAAAPAGPKHRPGNGGNLTLWRQKDCMAEEPAVQPGKLVVSPKKYLSLIIIDDMFTQKKITH